MLSYFTFIFAQIFCVDKCRLCVIDVIGNFGETVTFLALLNMFDSPCRAGKADSSS